jgi:hypothetical protein
VTAPLASYAVAGGGAVPVHQALRVFAGGALLATVAIPGTDDARPDEAGVYAWRLDTAGADALDVLLGEADPAAVSGGDAAMPPGTVRHVLTVGETTAQWSAFDGPPPALAATAARLRELLRETLAHPLAVVHLSARAEPATAGERLGVEVELANPGSEPAALTVAAVRLRLAPGAPAAGDFAPVETWESAALDPAPEPREFELGAGEAAARAVAGPAPAEPGDHRLDVFAEVALRHGAGDAALVLHALLVAPPVPVAIGPS